MSASAYPRVRETTGPGNGARAGRSSRNGAWRPVMLFRLGRLAATPGAIRTLTGTAADPIEYLARHLAGDWGDLNAADRAANDRALQSGERIISGYRLGNDQKIWIIPEADRARVFDRLSPFADVWIVDGIGGACWGLTAEWLARLADLLGRGPDADRLRARAVAAYRSSGATGPLRRITGAADAPSSWSGRTPQ